jgi:hypothetical protein
MWNVHHRERYMRLAAASNRELALLRDDAVNYQLAVPSGQRRSVTR